MREINKYYVLIIAFLMSIMSGYFFHSFKKTAAWPRYLLGGSMIIFSYVNLALVNHPFFNEYSMKIPWPEKASGFSSNRID